MKIPLQQEETNTANTQDFSKQVEAILVADLWSGNSTLGMKKQIADLLNGDKQKALLLLARDAKFYVYLPENLKSDRDIVKVLIEKDPKKYKMLPATLKQDTEIQKSTVTAIISGKGDVLDLIDVMITSEKKNKKLIPFTQALIESTPWFFTDAESKLLYEIFTQERKVYDQMWSRGLIVSSQGGISLWPSAANNLAQAQKKLEAGSIVETQEKLFFSLLDFLSLSEKSLWKWSKALLELLVDSIAISKKQEETEDIPEEVMDSQENTWEAEEDDANLSTGPYNYIPLWNSCRVWDVSGSSVLIEQKTFDTIGSKSLDNFMNFSRLMKRLWLDFLIHKQHRLSQLLTGVDFYQWEGMSEARTLKFLNSVGKNIWEPEWAYEDSQGNKKAGCFDTLSAAKHRFERITQLWDIWKHGIDVAKRGDKSVVEKYMESIQLIAAPFNEISVMKWKK